MKILCQKYTWLDEVEIKDVNFFSNGQRVVSPPIDLTDYLIKNSLGKFTLGIQNIDSGDFSLYIESGNVSFQLLNGKEWQYGQGISEYFGVYNLNKRQKFLVKFITDDGQQVFEGIIYGHNLDFLNRESEVLSVLVVGFEKEFKDYYSNIRLKEVSGWTNLPGISLQGLQVIPLIDVLEQNFNSEFLQIELSPALLNYKVAKYPYFYTPIPQFNGGTAFIKTGYESFRRDLCSTFDWINSTVLPMGWVYFFEGRKLHIKNLYELSYDVQVIDFEKTNITHSVENEIDDAVIENIIIDDGKYYSNGYLLTPTTSNPYPGFSTAQYVGGERKNVFSYQHDFSSRTLPWRNITFNGIDIYKIFYGNKTNIYLDTTEGGYRFREFTVWLPIPTVTYKEYFYDKNKTLKISPYIVSERNAGGLDINNARQSGGYLDIGNGNFFTSNIQMGDNDFRYTGSAANSLVLYNELTDKFETYFDYIQKPAFSNNMAKYLRNDAQLIFTLEVGELITSLAKTVLLNNYSFFILNGKKFTLQGLEFDIVKKTSSLKILLNNE